MSDFYRFFYIIIYSTVVGGVLRVRAVASYPPLPLSQQCAKSQCVSEFFKFEITTLLTFVHVVICPSCKSEYQGEFSKKCWFWSVGIMCGVKRGR